MDPVALMSYGQTNRPRPTRLRLSRDALALIDDTVAKARAEFDDPEIDRQRVLELLLEHRIETLKRDGGMEETRFSLFRVDRSRRLRRSFSDQYAWYGRWKFLDSCRYITTDRSQPQPPESLLIRTCCHSVRAAVWHITTAITRAHLFARRVDGFVRRSPHAGRLPSSGEWGHRL